MDDTNNTNEEVSRVSMDTTRHDSAESDVVYEESTEDGDAIPTKDVVKKLREENKKLRAEKEEYLTGWQRAKADYVNLQKDEEGKRKELRTYVTTGIIEDLLPALDSFDMAMGNKEAWEKVDANWRNGVEYIRAQFARVLEDHNVTAINQIGVPFDHNIHEAIETLPTDDESFDHTIAAIVQSGYKIGDRIIRPARVKVFEFKK